MDPAYYTINGSAHAATRRSHAHEKGADETNGVGRSWEWRTSVYDTMRCDAVRAMYESASRVLRYATCESDGRPLKTRECLLVNCCMTKCRRPRNRFRYLVLFSLFGSIWKHLDTDCFPFCTVLTLKRQMSENSKTSKWFQKKHLEKLTVFAHLSFQCQNGAKGETVSIQMLPNASK